MDQSEWSGLMKQLSEGLHGQGSRYDLTRGRQRDPRSGLPNRDAYFHQRLADARERSTIVVVTLCDAQAFDDISSTLGPELADRFLKAGAERLLLQIGRNSKVYHVGALAFAFRLPGCCEPSAPPLVARVIAGFRTPLNVEGIPIAATIGIGLFAARRGPCPAEELRAALSAAQKSHGTLQGWSWFDPVADVSRRRTYTILNELKTALHDNSQLELHYQPKVWLSDGTCDNAEALLRWNHPVLGFVPPGEFVPLVEATALVKPMTRWVIDAATRQMVAWREQGLNMRVAVNISPKNLIESDFVDYLRFTCEFRGIPPHLLELEVTEGISATGKAITNRISALRDFGFGIAIDDFGSGYSNMAYLTELSAHTLKIDRSLVHGATPNDRRGRLVSGIVQMGRDLGYTIVAEGIETDDECGALTALGCELGQGWLFGRPMPADQFAAWHAERSASRGQSASVRAKAS